MSHYQYPKISHAHGLKIFSDHYSKIFHAHYFKIPYTHYTKMFNAHNFKMPYAHNKKKFLLIITQKCFILLNPELLIIIT